MLRIAENTFYGLSKFLGGKLGILQTILEIGKKMVSFPLKKLTLRINLSQSGSIKLSHFVFPFQCNFTFSVHV